VGALVVAVAAITWLVLRGTGDTTYKLRFQTAGQLVKGDDVQVGGRRIGSVDDISLTDDNQAEITVSVSDDFAPLHEGTTAVIRATSLSGIANRYIALSPGPNNRPKLADGATLGTEQTTSIVDLDQVFDTLDAKTRRSLQNVIQGGARWYDGRGRQANEAARYLSPALSQSQALFDQLVGDQDTLSRFLTSASRTVGALARRRAELTALVGNANTTLGAIGDENVALGDALGLLPGTLRKANTTFVNLRATLDDLDVLVAASKPATRRLAPFLAELRPLLVSARPTVRDLSTLVHRAGPGNELTDLLLRTPKLERVAKPALAQSTAAFEQATPVLKTVRPYTTELTGWLRDFGVGAANYDANGHFARIAPAFSPYRFSDSASGGTLTPVPPGERLSAFQHGVIKRCPGAASQAPADGSAPYTDGGTLDCDPSLVLPGP
jgi:phospholipid/cholesterol/gamma-HCH transport system substrate-binding protein